LVYSLLTHSTSFICKYNSTVYLFVNTKEKFKSGCINPTIVLDKNRSLLAVFTSLTTSGTISFPVIKIYKEKLNLINKVQLENGTKLGSIALYSRPANEPYPAAWADFHPQVPNCFTDDYNKCEKIIESIKKEAWEALFLGIQQIEKIEEGLYKVELDNDLVQNAY